MSDETPLPAAVGHFDYDSHLSKEDANKAREIAASIRKTGHDAVIEIGWQLCEVNPWFKHGHFQEWVERECGISRRSAQKAMQAARVVRKNAKLAVLPIDTLIALEGKSVTTPILDQVANKIDAGEMPTASEVRKLIPKSTPSGNATSAATEDVSHETEQPELPPATLENLKALWQRADAEARTLFRQYIEGGDGTAAAD